MKQALSALDEKTYNKGMLKALRQLKREGGKLFSRRDFELRAKYLVTNPKHQEAFVTAMMKWRTQLVRDCVAKILKRKRWKDSKGRGVLTRIRMDLRRLVKT